MKKQIYPLTLIIISSLLLQGCCALRILTINATPGMTTVSGSPSWKPALGISAGAALCLADITELLSISGEGSISMQGAGWSEAGYEGRTNLLYFNLPLVIRYQTEGGFFGEAGLQPGLLLSAKDKYEGITDDYLDHMNRMDVGIPFGIGYEFKNNFGIGVRVIPGLADITKDEDDKDRNFVVGLRATYRLKLKR